MPEFHRTACLSQEGRLSNDEFTALMASAVRCGRDSSRSLFLAAAPVLIAFYEGHVRAGRLVATDVESLVQRALANLYRARAGFAAERQPFRAWLLDIARDSMLDYRRERSGHAIKSGRGAGKESEPEKARRFFVSSTTSDAAKLSAKPTRKIARPA